MNASLSVPNTGVLETNTRREPRPTQLLQPQPCQPWYFRAEHLSQRHPVASREHARMLIRSVDVDWPWVTLDTADGSTFAQVSGGPDGMIIEVNSLPRWIQRVARIQPSDRMLTVGNPGDEDRVLSSEWHTAIEAIGVCFAWLDRREVPVGFCLHDYVD